MSKTINLGPVSAYALAKKHGFVGTEAEWLKSLGAHIGGNGNWWVGDTDTGVLADPAHLQELTRQAAASAEAAGQSAQVAKGAKDAAESARNGAESAQAAAETAQQGAEVARDLSETAADNAAKSASSAQESKKNAEQSAQSALKSKTASEENRNASDASAASAAKSEKNAIAAAESVSALAYILDDRDGKRYNMSWGISIDGFPKLTFQEVTA